MADVVGRGDADDSHINKMFTDIAAAIDGGDTATSHQLLGELKSVFYVTW